MEAASVCAPSTSAETAHQCDLSVRFDAGRFLYESFQNECVREEAWQRSKVLKDLVQEEWCTNRTPADITLPFAAADVV